LLIAKVVTIGKEPSALWPELKPAIGMTIRTQLLTGVPAILEMPVHTGTQRRADTEIRELVQEPG
jgi:hypothetical protein